MDAKSVAQVLDDLGTILEIRGENPFRCRAYHTAAQAVRGQTDDLAEMLAEGRLKDVPGLGDTMRDKITRLVTTGRLEEFDRIRQETPTGLLALLRVPGLGPKKVQMLHKDHGISSLDDLKKAAESGEIAAMKGFGAKTAANILEGIAFIETSGERLRLHKADRLAAPLVEALRGMPGVTRADVGGSLRRRAETIGDLDLLFESDQPAAVLEALAKRPEVETILGHGPTKLSVRLTEGVQVDVRGVSSSQYPFAL